MATLEMDGKVCVVTGSTSGIGKAAATELARRGATVVIVARDRTRGEATVAEIAEVAGSRSVELELADLASQASIRDLAERIRESHPRLDVLINGTHIHHHERIVTEDGVEEIFAVTYLSYFVLTNLLLDALDAGAAARIVNIADDLRIVRRSKLDFDDLLGERSFGGLAMHNRAKKCVFLFTFELARRLAGTGVTANCLFPGHIDTGLKGDFPGFVRYVYPLTKALGLLKPPEAGADPVVYLATSPEVEGVTGKHFVKRKPVEPPPDLDDPETAQRLWEVSERLANLTPISL